MALSDIEVRNAKPGVKAAKLFDGRGLHLVVTPAGGKLWRLKYRVAGKEKLLSLGAYPAVTLAAARRAVDRARDELAAGRDPALEKRRGKEKARGDAGNTFAAIAAEYIDRRKADGARPYSASTVAKAKWFAELLHPTIGHMPVASIEPADILAALRKWSARAISRRPGGACNSRVACCAMPSPLRGSPAIPAGTSRARFPRRA